MYLTIGVLFLLLAAICFMLAVCDIRANKTIPLGLFFVTLFFLVGRVGG